MTKPPVAVVAPSLETARSASRRIARRLPGVRLAPYGLEGFARDREAPGRIVLVPAGRRVAEDAAFLARARRRILWPPPPPELAGAIAGLRGEHDAVPAAPAAGRSRSRALLLEGDVTEERAGRAAVAGAPRDWIVERVQRVRIGASGLDALHRLGVRLSVLEPVDVVAIAASEAFARSLARRRFLAGIPVWVRTPEARGDPRSAARRG